MNDLFVFKNNILIISIILLLLPAVSCSTNKSKSLHQFINQYGDDMPKNSKEYQEVKNVLNILKGAINPNHHKAIDNIKIYVVNSNDLIATSYDDMKIVFSSCLFSNAMPCSPTSKDALVGIILHEACHVIFDHTRVRQKWVKDNYYINAVNINKHVAKYASMASQFSKSFFYQIIVLILILGIIYIPLTNLIMSGSLRAQLIYLL